MSHLSHVTVFHMTGHLPVPVGNALVCDSRSDVEHNDRALTLNAVVGSMWVSKQMCTGEVQQYLLVTVSETAELFLASSVPNIKLNRATASVKLERVHLHTESG